MSLREKKPPLKPERRQEWLERYEAGQSPPTIAAADGFDVRTVRKHIDIAKQEKETKEARASVLRNALERHYADLCRYAERLGQRPDGRSTDRSTNVSDTERYGQYLGIALRQHLPRSPIWSLLTQQSKLRVGKGEFTGQLVKKIEEEIKADPRLLNGLTHEKDGIAVRIVEALTSQALLWVQGEVGEGVDYLLKTKPAKDGLVDLSYGGYSMGKVGSEHVGLIREIINHWAACIREWDGYNALKKTWRDLERVERDLSDEIAVIALRRVVPGRCRYCPV